MLRPPRQMIALPLLVHGLWRNLLPRHSKLQQWWYGWLLLFLWISFGFSGRSFLDDRSSIASISPWTLLLVFLLLMAKTSSCHWFHVVPLSKLPSTKETVQLPLFEIFGLHGLTVAAISYRGAELEPAWVHCYSCLP